MKNSKDNISRSRTPPENHTSIVYFHGMGTPKRYEELSRVLDTLDRYGAIEGEEKLGVLRGQSVGLEPSRCGSDEPVSFFRFSRFLLPLQGKSVLVGRYRLYENYWSPAAAGAVSALGVLAWILTRAFHPFRVLTKPWRAHQRMKRTYLYRMFYDRGAMPALRYRQLASAYREFEGMDARRKYPRGGFKQFQAHLAARYPNDAQARADLAGLATSWRRQMLKAQAGMAVLAVTLLSASAGVVAAVIYLAAFLACAAGLDWPLASALVARAGPISPWMNFAAAVGFLFGVIALIRFLELFLSDVVFWTTTFEKDVRYKKRREILAASEDTLCHVIADPNCERIVIMGHSLGSAIAYQTLLNLGRRVTAEQQAGILGPSRYDGLRKVSHFITLGSPIDRINYFFHLTFSPYHRFNRVSDELMGRSSDPPFKVPGVKPGTKERVIQWINVRDRSDPIASRLFSPRGSLPNRDEIQEVEVSSSHFPGPGSAHTGYFGSELAAKVLYDACILGRATLQLQMSRPIWSRVAGSMLRFMLATLAFLLAWDVAAGAIGYAIGSHMVMGIAQATGLVLIGLIALGRVTAALLDRAHRLTLAP